MKLTKTHNMKYNSTPITQRAKSSPFRMNEALIAGAAAAAPGFVDAGKLMKDSMPTGMTPPPGGTVEKTKGEKLKQINKDTEELELEMEMEELEGLDKFLENN